jgi:hypothetical protein
MRRDLEMIFRDPFFNHLKDTMVIPLKNLVTDEEWKYLVELNDTSEEVYIRLVEEL